MRTKILHKPAEWQTDWKNVTTGNVQFWRNGIMITAQMSMLHARQLVEDGTAFVMSDQAIGALSDGFMMS